MNPASAKPVVIVSKCLGFATCRYNGIVIEDAFVRKLEGHVEFHPVCPEMEIGLGCPRQPIRIVRQRKQDRLVQPATGRDMTTDMTGFTDDFLSRIDAVDGFILKHKSPSCGLANVKIFSTPAAKTPTARAAGFFGRAVKARFFDLPIEDEDRLHNFTIREHFLTQLFTLARFRLSTASAKMKDLVAFHTTHKYLLMIYNQSALKRLGRLVANDEKRPVTEILIAYRTELGKALAHAPRFTSAINVLMHAMGHVSDKLNAKEKAYFLDTLESYRNEKVPLSVPVGVLKSWNARFDESYLADQVFFEPYPEALVEITDSGKGRKIG